MNSKVLAAFISIIICASCSDSKPVENPELATYYLRKAAYFDYYGPPDSTFFYYSNFVAITTDSLEKGKAYNRMGVIQYDAGDYFGAQESLMGSVGALDPAKPSHDSCLLSTYNALANISLDLKNYDEAIHYFEVASSFSHKKDYKLAPFNGKAVAFQKKGNYPEALRILDSILIEKPGDSSILARILSNRARTKWLQDKNSEVLPDFRHAFSIRKKSGEPWGLNASFAHLSDYYADVNKDSAYYFAQQMYEIAGGLNSAPDKLEALAKLSKVGPMQNQQQYFNEYRRVSDSLQFARNIAKNQFAIFRYDVARSKAENQELQRDITKQRIFTYAAIAASALVILIGIIAYRRRQRRTRRDSENAIRENRLRTSQKVHDVVANGLYRIMNDLEHRDQVNKEDILDKVELLYEQSRDISYETPGELPTSASSRQITEMLSSFATPDRKIIFAGDVDGALEKLPIASQAQLKHVLEELMINMKKHSRAKNVMIRFKEDHGDVNIHYKDDGTGLPEGTTFGNGLKSTVNRILTIGGQINFESSGKEGTNIEIIIPRGKTTS